MKIFFAAIKKEKKYPYSLHDDFKILQILDAVELSNIKEKKIEIRAY